MSIGLTVTAHDFEAGMTVADVRDWLARWDAECDHLGIDKLSAERQATVKVPGMLGFITLTAIQAEVPVEQS